MCAAGHCASQTHNRLAVPIRRRIIAMSKEQEDSLLSLDVSLNRLADDFKNARACFREDAASLHELHMRNLESIAKQQAKME